MAASVTDFKMLSEQADQATDQFSSLYYGTFDKQRHLLSKLYTDISTVVWNGNAYHGVAKINEFFINLPATSHEVSSLDCQPISSIASPDTVSIMVIVEGNVRYGDDRKRIYFTQSFMLASDNNKWKIVTDTFRFIDNE